MAQVLDTAAAQPQPCVRCGADSDFEIASMWLCVGCYHVAGSTCAGIGRVPTIAPPPRTTATATAAAPGTSPATDVLAELDIADQVC
jgi:hypothetical protein